MSKGYGSSSYWTDAKQILAAKEKSQCFLPASGNKQCRIKSGVDGKCSEKRLFTHLQHFLDDVAKEPARIISSALGAGEVSEPAKGSSTINVNAHFQFELKDAHLVADSRSFLAKANDGEKARLRDGGESNKLASKTSDKEVEFSKGANAQQEPAIGERISRPATTTRIIPKKDLIEYEMFFHDLPDPETRIGVTPWTYESCGSAIRDQSWIFPLFTHYSAKELQSTAGDGTSSSQSDAQETPLETTRQPEAAAYQTTCTVAGRGAESARELHDQAFRAVSNSNAHTLYPGAAGGILKIVVPPASVRICMPRDVGRWPGRRTRRVSEDGSERPVKDLFDFWPNTLAFELQKAGGDDTTISRSRTSITSLHDISLLRRDPSLVSFLCGVDACANLLRCGDDFILQPGRSDDLACWKRELRRPHELATLKARLLERLDPGNPRHRCPYQVQAELLDCLTVFWREYSFPGISLEQVGDPRTVQQLCTVVRIEIVESETNRRKKELRTQEENFNNLFATLRHLLFGSEQGPVLLQHKDRPYLSSEQQKTLPVLKNAPRCVTAGTRTSKHNRMLHPQVDMLLPAIDFSWKLVFPAMDIGKDHFLHISSLLKQAAASHNVGMSCSVGVAGVASAGVMSGNCAHATRGPGRAAILEPCADLCTSDFQNAAGVRPLELRLDEATFEKSMGGAVLGQRMLAAVAIRGGVDITVQWYLEEVREYPKSAKFWRQHFERKEKYQHFHDWARPLEYKNCCEFHQVCEFVLPLAATRPIAVSPESSTKEQLMEASHQYATEAFRPRRALVLSRPLPEKWPAFQSRRELRTFLLAHIGQQYDPAQDDGHVWVAPLPLPDGGGTESRRHTKVEVDPSLIFIPIGPRKAANSEASPDPEETVAMDTTSEGHVEARSSSGSEAKIECQVAPVGPNRPSETIAASETPKEGAGGEVAGDTKTDKKRQLDDIPDPEDGDFAVFRLGAAYHLDFSRFGGWKPPRHQPQGRASGTKQHADDAGCGGGEASKSRKRGADAEKSGRFVSENGASGVESCETAVAQKSKLKVAKTEKGFVAAKENSLAD
ncbi:unnamed protein product [Amoebophrya sp. A120]|nr:unnamed protein product [Amoebophrya sp. A120]|eukprot:GSA120T00018632001.1